MLCLHQHSVVSPALVLFHVCGVSFGEDEKRQGEKTFYDYENKLETKMIQTKTQITLQSLLLTVLKPSDTLKNPNPGFSEYLRLTTGFYAFLKPLILTLQPLGPSQCILTALSSSTHLGAAASSSPYVIKHVSSRQYLHHQVHGSVHKGCGSTITNLTRHLNLPWKARPHFLV